MVGSSLSIALSGLQASTRQVAAAASNIANVQTVGSLEEGGQAPYNPVRPQQQAVSIAGTGAGVRSDVVPRQDNPFVPAFDPDSPFADADGIIGVPNISLAEEAVRLLTAETTFRANVAVVEAVEENFDALLDAVDETV